jgi:4-carboxymuconolactone decarboxylase
MTPAEDREQMGLRKLREIAGEQADKPLGDWNKVAPDMRGYIVEFVAGDILSRPGLDPKSRQLATGHASRHGYGTG